MKTVFAYVRVSTVKQGEHGVSLQEQREAIERYASKNNLRIVQWFEERETAAKRGRPVFSEMLSLLKGYRANGVIIHKIDRSARNLTDWADLIELSEKFRFEVHFANEGVDLSSRGGRLSADIQAVVATDFIRNLREEARKGFYGRLKQGLYPLPAPIGYRDTGRGKPKEPDPVTAPLVRYAFGVYATGSCNFLSLREQLANRGLRTRQGSPLSLNGISVMLNNPFYAGLIRLKRTNETFRGVHEPIVSAAIFERVQKVLKGKTNTRGVRHDFQYRRLVACASCRHSLIGELQKGRVYYRCQTKQCPVTCIREDVIDASVQDLLSRLIFSAEEEDYLDKILPSLQEIDQKEREASATALNLRLGQVKDRFVRLTDAYIDRMIDREVFEQRKTALLLEQKKLEEQSAEIARENLSVADRAALYLELSKSAYFLYELGFPEEKRELLKILTSNRTASGKNVEFTLFPAFQVLANQLENANGTPQRCIPRTLDEMLHKLVIIIRDTPMELFDRISDFLSATRKEDPTPLSSRFHEASDNNGNIPAG